MLLFDWKKIFTAAAGDPHDIVRILRLMVEKRVPTNKYDKLYFYSQIDFRGESFLAHPERLLYNNFKHSYRDVGVYVALASLRPLADYQAYGKITLDPLHAPDDVLKAVETNSLLSMENGEIHFLYERSPSKMEIH